MQCIMQPICIIMQPICISPFSIYNSCIQCISITFEVVITLFIGTSLLVAFLQVSKAFFNRISSLLQVSTGERPILDILQDRRYWVIHLITIPSLFVGGVILVLSGFVYKLFGVANNGGYLNNSNTQISLINDRFSILNEIEDI
jgi:photosystem II cytochrome b559 subunit alpha